MTRPIQFQVYSTKPLDQALRAGFFLGADPYKVGKIPQADAAISYLVTNHICFYRDQRNSLGIVLQPPEFDLPIRYVAGFIGYKSSGFLKNNYKICTYAEIGLFKYSEHHLDMRKSKVGDTYAWLQWNIPVHIVSIDEERVQIA